MRFWARSNHRSNRCLGRRRANPSPFPFGGEDPIDSEPKKQPSNALIQLETNKRKKPLAPLEEGQLWKTDNGYIPIWHISKRLVDYKMIKQPGRKAVRTQSTMIDTLADYSKAHKAVLS